ncbi:MAG: chemotaxis protein CheW [Polaromonas sp.]|nr:chemotaxis protein CheW [Polaromonas sp.]
MLQATGQRLAQGIICGQWALAFSFDWARQIVERFELSAVPKSPHWLLGSANVDGSIVPVVDLTRYFGTSAGAAPAGPQRRLLVGGLTGVDSDDAMALAFTGLPQQLKYSPAPLTDAGALPSRLREVCDGIARDAGGRDFLEINTRMLKAILADELSLR